MQKLVNKTLKWELRGIVSFVALGVLLLVPQLLLHNDAAPFRVANKSWIAIASPVLAVWEKFGFRGVEDLRVVIPMIGSVLVYLAGLGFITGLLVHRMLGSRENRLTNQ
jgi:hypothetical protein